MGIRNFERFKAYQARVAAEEWLANHPEYADAHLATSPQTKAQAATATKVIQLASQVVESQQQSIAMIARNLYEAAGILTGNLDTYSTLLNSTNAAQSTSTAVATEISNASASEKTNLANISKSEVSMLLS